MFVLQNPRVSKLKLPPIVGMALPLPLYGDSDSSEDEGGSEDGGETVEDNGGQLFCFLPLPTKARSPTGLKPHVNGCFSVSQNR